ncbi:MAG: PTS sugar transporter subunit IIA [Sphaerochaeta sp.]
MNVLEVLEKDLIKVPLESSEKYAVIKELVEVAAHAKGYDKNAMLEAILARERLGSTGIGNGIAIPHAKSDVVTTVTMVIGISKLPIDFESIDNQKAKIFFLVIAPSKEASAHVELLASIARSCSSGIFRRMLEQAKDADEVIQLFME